MMVYTFRTRIRWRKGCKILHQAWCPVHPILEIVAAGHERQASRGESLSGALRYNLSTQSIVG